jgi:hypothetical protein
LAIQRASRVAFGFIVVAPPENVTSTVVSVAIAAAAASERKRVFMTS